MAVGLTQKQILSQHSERSICNYRIKTENKGLTHFIITIFNM